MAFASVVICTMRYPRKVLKALEKQTFKDFEVIIASEKGIVHAMNFALERATGSIFIRVDDDVEIPATWLESLIKPFKDPSVGGVTGPTFVPAHLRHNRDSIKIWERPNWFFKWLRDWREFAPAAIFKCGTVSYDSNYPEKFRWPFKSDKPYEVDHLEGTNWAMRTELIRRVGGFDTSYDGVCEWFDTDVEYKVKKLGYKMMYSNRAWLFHMLEKGGNYNERFQGLGRIKNWVRFHRRHSKFHPKMVVFLAIWIGYFICKKFQ